MIPQECQTTTDDQETADMKLDWIIGKYHILLSNPRTKKVLNWVYCSKWRPGSIVREIGKWTDEPNDGAL